MRRYFLLVLVGFLSCALVSAKTIGLSCWIVAEDDEVAEGWGMVMSGE